MNTVTASFNTTVRQMAEMYQQKKNCHQLFTVESHQK